MSGGSEHVLPNARVCKVCSLRLEGWREHCNDLLWICSPLPPDTQEAAAAACALRYLTC